MTTPAVPPKALAFAASCLGNHQDLDILMLLIDSGGRWWDAEKVAREVGVATARAREVLDRFAGRNLLDIRVTGAIRYRFCPGTRELDTAAHAFARAYRHHPAAVRALVADLS